MGATPGYNKARKAQLEREQLIHCKATRGGGCGRCRYHRGENAVPQARPDGYKNHRRAK